MLTRRRSRLYTWGWGYHGQTGHEHVPLAPRVQALYYPTLLPIGGASEDIVAIGCGHFHALAATRCYDTSRTLLYGWGYNEALQLGQQPPQPIGSGHRPDIVPSPQRIPLPSSIGEVQKLVGSGVASALLTQNGELYTWGSNKRAQLGRSDKDVPVYTPGLVHDNLHHEQIVDIALGWGHALALTATNRVYSWGWGEQGQLGLGDYTHKAQPTEIVALRDKSVTKVAAGADCSLAVTAEGQVYVFGRNEYWPTGMPTEFYRQGETRGVSVPTPIAGIPARIRDIACGLGHFVARTAHSGVLVWGLGKEGQLGLGDTLPRSAPTWLVSETATEGGKESEGGIRQVVCGRVHTTLMDSQGELHTCGYGRFGRLGLGDEDSQLTLTPIQLDIDDVEREEKGEGEEREGGVIDIACGYDFTLCIK